MLKAKSASVLILSIIFALSFVSLASARNLTPQERKSYAQNNIIFYVPCESESENSKTNCNANTPKESPSTDPGNSTTPTDPSNTTPTNEPNNGSEPTPGNNTPSGGTLGHTSVSGFYRQFGNNTVWKCPTSSDNAKIKNSGCPLVAIANALHAQNSSITLDTLIQDIKSYHNGCTNKGNLFGSDWSNNGKEIIKWGANKHSASFSSISSSQIDSILASGGAIVVGGNRNNSQKGPSGHNADINCKDSSNINAGKCVFSAGGHFVTIIGKTKEGKYVVTNPANGSLATYSLDTLQTYNYNLNFYAIKL